MKAGVVKAPLIGKSSVNVECQAVQILEFSKFHRISRFVIGKVVLIHLKEEYCRDGEIQKNKLKAIGRLGGELYCRTGDTFTMKRTFQL